MIKMILYIVLSFISVSALATPPPSTGTCTVTTTPVNFGAYNVFNNTPTDTIGQITVACTGVGTTYSVAIQLNKGLVGSIDQRKLQQTNGNDFLRYNLYIDAGRSTIWGDGTDSSVTQTINVIGGTSQTLTIYGRIPQLQDVSMGDYNDTVGVTINF